MEINNSNNGVNTLVGFIAGLVGGCANLINSGIHFNSINIGLVHWEANIEAMLMAFVCGLGGVFGKHLFGLIIKFFKRKKQSDGKHKI